MVVQNHLFSFFCLCKSFEGKCLSSEGGFVRSCVTTLFQLVSSDIISCMHNIKPLDSSQSVSFELSVQLSCVECSSVVVSSLSTIIHLSLSMYRMCIMLLFE